MKTYPQTEEEFQEEKEFQSWMRWQKTAHECIVENRKREYNERRRRLEDAWKMELHENNSPRWITENEPPIELTKKAVELQTKLLRMRPWI